MRNGAPRQNNRRLMGQLSRAMDRTGDAVLHRVRPQGTERINMHNRQPPRGPRGELSRNRGIPNGPASGVNGPKGGPANAIAQMTPQQQMQLFSFYEQQARMMSEILSPQQQQMLLPQVPLPAINPSFRNGSGNHPAGKSLFDRVESRNGNFNNYNKHRPQNNRNGPQSIGLDDAKMGDGNQGSEMEVEGSKDTVPAETVCRFNLYCTKSDCHFAHQSPAAPPDTPIDVHDVCSFGVACQNRKCTGRHPSPAQKKSHQADQECKFYPNCTNPRCPFRHPSAPPCRNGADCSTPGCKFTHVKTLCKFNPCLNPACIFKHEEGQKRGKFHDKVWKAEGDAKEHISERKFLPDGSGEEELIRPDGNHEMGGSQSPHGAELIT
jgi:hypothetical protein